MDFLVEKNFILHISLDGDELSQSYRVDHSGKNSFNQIFRNVKLLQSTHPKYVVTMDEYCTGNYNGILQLHLKDFLMKRSFS